MASPSAKCAPEAVKRVGMVIELKPECEAEYLRVHSDGHAGVRHLLGKWNLRNFNIYLWRQPGTGKIFEFAHYEYDGTAFEADMAGLDAEPENVAWHKLCDPMQVASDTSNDGVGAWTVLERAYYNA